MRRRCQSSVDKIYIALAIIILIANILILIGLAGVWYFMLALTAMDGGESIFNTRFWKTYEIFMLTILPMALILNIVLSIFLCNGICRKQPKPARATFVLSVVITIVVALISVILVGETIRGNLQYKTLVGYLISCVLQSVFLMLVYLAHKNLVRNARLAELDRLLEEERNY